MVEYELGPSNGSSTVFFESSESMDELDDGSVDLVVSSPPYNIEYDYGEYDDGMSEQEYRQMLSSVMGECFRVLKKQGRVCINVPDLTRKGSKGGVSQLRILMNVLRDSHNEWQFREVIIWNKGSGKPPIHNTFPKPWGVLLNNTHEAILVAQKPGRRRGISEPNGIPSSESEYENPPEDVTRDVWNIPQVNKAIEHNGEVIPTYPSELPERLVKLYSFKGDTVLDPFAGAGTTLSAANKAGRDAVGYELRDSLKPVLEEQIGTVRFGTNLSRF